MINLQPQEAGHALTQATHNAPGELNLRHRQIVSLKNKKTHPPSASHHPHPSPLPPPTAVNQTFSSSLFYSLPPTHPALEHHNLWRCGMDK